MRLKNIVLTELIHDRLIAYEELERVMNSRGSIESIVVKSKRYLNKIVKFNAMINEWQDIMKTDIDTADFGEWTKKLKNEENG